MPNKIRCSIVSLLTVSLFFALSPITTRSDTFRPVVRGKRGVVAGGQPLSVEAGLRMLQKGGNAVDAGVATILAASVIEFSHFSFGGEVPILIKLKGAEVVELTAAGSPVEIALDTAAMTGFLAWVEAIPPGATLPG